VSLEFNFGFNFSFENLRTFEDVGNFFGLFLEEKTHTIKRPDCELDPVFVGPNGLLKKTPLSPQKVALRLYAYLFVSKCTSHKFVYQTFVTKPQFSRYQTCPTKSSLN